MKGKKQLTTTQQSEGGASQRTQCVVMQCKISFGDIYDAIITSPLFYVLVSMFITIAHKHKMHTGSHSDKLGFNEWRERRVIRRFVL